MAPRGEIHLHQGEMMNCRNCEHWERKDSGEKTLSDTGYCVRYPSVFMGSELAQTKLGQTMRRDNWGKPLTKGGDRCGEHMLKITEDKKN